MAGSPAQSVHRTFTALSHRVRGGQRLWWERPDIQGLGLGEARHGPFQHQLEKGGRQLEPHPHSFCSWVATHNLGFLI